MFCLDTIADQKQFEIDLIKSIDTLLDENVSDSQFESKIANNQIGLINRCLTNETQIIVGNETYLKWSTIESDELHYPNQTHFVHSDAPTRSFNRNPFISSSHVNRSFVGPPNQMNQKKFNEKVQSLLNQYLLYNLNLINNKQLLNQLSIDNIIDNNMINLMAANAILQYNSANAIGNNYQPQQHQHHIVKQPILNRMQQDQTNGGQGAKFCAGQTLKKKLGTARSIIFPQRYI